MSLAVKKLELEKLDNLSESIPNYTLAPAYDLLEGIGNYCPKCGAVSQNLTKEIVEEKVIKQDVKETVTTTDAKPRTISRVKCPYCKGSGVLGRGLAPELGKNETAELRCMNCQGTGTMSVTPKVDPKRMKEIAQKSAELESKQTPEAKERILKAKHNDI